MDTVFENTVADVFLRQFALPSDALFGSRIWRYEYPFRKRLPRQRKQMAGSSPNGIPFL